MSLKKWFRNMSQVFAAPNRRRASSWRRGATMRFETLEDRTTPTTLSNFLTVEHVDIEIGYSGGPAGEWSFTAHDDENEIEHDSEDGLLYVGTPALSTRTGGDGLGFVGVAAGETFYRLPQSQNPNLLYLGFSSFSSDDFDRYDVAAESGGRSSGEGQWLRVSLVGVEHFLPDGSMGTGQFSTWQNDLDGPVPFMTSSDGFSGDDALWITTGGHLHYNFGFSQPGRYEVSLKASGYFIEGGGSNPSAIEGTFIESDPIKVYFSVGSVGQVQFGTASTLVNEQAGYRSITVNRVGGSDGEIKINYATSDDTATVADGDYVATSGTLVFADGETEKVITVQVANAGVDIGNEAFNLTLSVPASVDPGDTGYLNSYLIGTTGVGLLGTIPTTAVTINDTPTMTGIGAQTTTIGTATAPIAFTVGDAETAAGSITLSATSSNPQLVPVSNIAFGGSGASRTVTVTPVAGLSGSSRIYIIATDENGAEITANFTLQVGNATALTAIAIDGSTPANSVPNVTLGADDSFTLNYTVTNSAWVTNVTFVELDNTNLINSHGTGSTSDLRTQPGTSGATARSLRVRGRDKSTAAGDYGAATVTVGFTGSGAPTNTHTFNVRVNPRAVADNWLLAIPGTTSTFDVLSNDAVPLSGHTFAITAVSGASNGTLTIAPDGKTLRYTPTNLTTGIDRFTYTVTVSSSDGFNGYSFTGQASVKIGGYVVVDSPTASQHIDLDFDFAGGVWTQKIRTDSSIVGSVESGTFGPSTYDADEGVIFFDPSTKQPRSAAPSLDVLGVPAGADVWFGPTSSSGNKVYLGIANESTTGIDAYTPVGDPRATSNASWVRTDLVGFSGPGHFAAFNGSDVAFDTFDGLNSSSDSTSGGNVSDTFWGFAGSHAHPAWYFTAPGEYELTFRSTVRVGGVFVTSPDTTFTFYVDTMSGNARLTENPPLALNDTATVGEDSGLTTINVLANDSSSADPFEVLAVTGVTQGSHGGAIAIGSGGAYVTYTPAADFNGIEMFTYTVTDEHGGTATATVTVTALPDSPVATADAFVVSSGNAVHGNVLFNDTDADGGPLTAILGSGPAHGVLDLNLNGSFSYTPNNTFAGSDSFTYTAFEGVLSSTTTTVTITAAGSQNFDVVITEGHVDIGIAYENDAWDLHVHDEENDVEYEPDEALIYAGNAALTTRLGGSQYDFIGVAAGASYYQIPNSEIAGVPFLGFGLEEIDDGTFAGNTVTLSLLSVNGPGQFSLWRNSGLDIAFATSDDITALDSVELPTGEHEHYNYAFTAPGRYEVTVQATGILEGETEPTTSDPVTYYFFVGPPTVTSISPFVGPTVGGTQVVIEGFGFYFDDTLTEVKFGDAVATIVSISPGQLVVSAPSGSLGTVNVTVTTPGGASADAGSSDDFTYANPLLLNVAINAGTAPISNYALSGNVVTVTTAGNTTYSVGQSILIAGMSNLANNGAFVVQTASAGTNSFTFVNDNVGAASAGFGGTVTAVGGAGSLSGAQRSMIDSIVYTFDMPVAFGANAFTVALNAGASGTPGTVPTVHYASPDGGTTWVVTFSGAGVTGNSIADGVYDITLNGSGFTSPGTLANRTDTFLRRFGDINGNGIVTGLTDFNAFKATLGLGTGNPAYVAAFDFNANGNITGLGDFNPFKTRLGSPAWTGFTVTL